MASFGLPKEAIKERWNDCRSLAVLNNKPQWREQLSKGIVFSRRCGRSTKAVKRTNLGRIRRADYDEWEVKSNPSNPSRR
ncbi:MAG: hypothetical protein A2743_00770 [Candidatus Taylorbacteria bacterium RIFCSPHIGHO2_01_FULL_43_47]|nr:MAG: hypothetical protein A2743_00770 [Candidatus Taylorbacteria bacterium RIFCSPHIGHO2_01_FULL_43_47]